MTNFWRLVSWKSHSICCWCIS